MIRNYLLITFRNMMKNKLYVLINVFGMATAIACCIVAYFNYKFNDNFDGIHEHAAHIYRINSIREFQNEHTAYGNVPLPLGEVMRRNVSDLEAVTRFSPSSENFRIDKDVFNIWLSYVDPDFFNLFTFNFLSGTARNLDGIKKMVISDQLAKRLFGTEPAVGKVITQLGNDDQRVDFEVVGVYEMPPLNSSFRNDAYLLFDNLISAKPEDETNWNQRTTLFVMLNDATRISAIENQIRPYRENNNEINQSFVISNFKFDPFVGMGVRNEYAHTPGVSTRFASPLAAISGMIVLAILALLIACFNMTNTSIAISSRRLKEIGLRKVMGGLKFQLIGLFMGETFFISFLALTLGVVIACFFFIPAWNALWSSMKLTPDFLGNPGFSLLLVLLVGVTAILSGIYPAFYVTRFQPAGILKGSVKYGGAGTISMILLMLQFGISLSGIVCSIAFAQNAVYQKEYDVGFNKDDVIFSYVGGRSAYETYRNALLGQPDIEVISGTHDQLFARTSSGPVRSGETEMETRALTVGNDYVKTVGLTVLQGRDFIRDSENDRQSSILVTEKFVREFGWTDPIGQEIIWKDSVKLYVVGVLKDIYQSGLWNEVEPLMLRLGSPDQYDFLIVKAPTEKLTVVNAFMKDTWKQVFPSRLYNGRYMNEDTVDATNVNNSAVKMFIFLGIVMLILSATGLFTMVSLNILKRMKEIGVRKVLGASVAHIAAVTNRKFFLVLAVSAIFGCLLGSFLTSMLMAGIWKYYQRPTITSFIFSIAILFIVSMLSIGFKIIRSAQMNPVNVLRNE